MSKKNTVDGILCRTHSGAVMRFTGFYGSVWNAKRVTFDGRDYWLGAIDGTVSDGWPKLIAVAGSDDVDGTKESAIEFVQREATLRGLGDIKISVRLEVVS